MSSSAKYSFLYRGEKTTQLTSHHLQSLLPTVLQKITERFQDRPEAVLAAWSQIIGPKLAPMTQATSYRDGVLTVKVKNSTLFSLLNQQEKPRLVRRLKEQFPHLPLKTIVFRMG